MRRDTIGRDVPTQVTGLGKFEPFVGAWENTPLGRREKGSRTLPRLNK